ncbi:MAG: hypothetical protein HC933_20910 [Pleurocapsa sp. SU_196_0]|nr:hypothetical protein [Pleurocapsa sp. SU_196_0]
MIHASRYALEVAKDARLHHSPSSKCHATVMSDAFKPRAAVPHDLQ